MPELVPPGPRWQKSFLESVEEIRAANEDEHTTGLSILPPIGSFPGESVTLEQLRAPDEFTRFTVRLRELADPEIQLPDDIVPTTQLWWVSGTTYLGRLSIRHTLTGWLRQYGGHIGYGVRPSARCQGHASAMLAASLPAAKRLGIDPALLTCDDTNLASRKVIEACGGRLEDQQGRKLRFWVSTA
jgi:predicted acetyltransferase